MTMTGENKRKNRVMGCHAFKRIVKKGDPHAHGEGGVGGRWGEVSF